MVDSQSSSYTQVFFTPEEEALHKRIQRHPIWRAIQDALCMERERLFSEPVTGPDQRAEIWGAIQAINRVLHTGPMLVVQSKRSMRSQETATPQPSEPAGAPAPLTGPSFEV